MNPQPITSYPHPHPTDITQLNWLPPATYLSATIYTHYRCIAIIHGRQPASHNILSRHLTTLGWQPGRDTTGNHRTWTKPSPSLQLQNLSPGGQLP